MARYEIIAGSYSGTSDDVAGRWYLVDNDADIIDKRGRGFASKAAALETLVERLTARPEPVDLVGRVEIAQRAETTPGTIDAWRQRHDDFPEPLVKLASGPVWAWPQVEAWLAKPRPAGRPHKA